MGYPFDSGDHNILWLAIGGPRKGLPIAPRFQACDGHGACVILDRPETQPRGPIACRPASGAPGCILGAVCWRPWIDQTTTPRGYLSQVDTPFPFIAGRTFTERESQGDSNVVIVSENVVRRFWPGDNPIGKRIRAGREGSGAPWLTIVGVVNEMKYRGLPSNPTEDPDLFLPFSERQRNFALLVRTSNGASSMETSVRRALHEADPALVAYATSTLDRLVSRQTAGRRFTGWLMGIFAVSALLLAMIGIYGVSSYTVARRTQEIGIRIALGAERSNVLRLVTGDLLGLVAGGLAVGLVAALALTRLIESLLYGIKPSDPQTFIAAGLSLLGVAVLASLVPALRATRIRPAVTLRDE